MRYVECIVLGLKKILGLAARAVFERRTHSPKELVCIYLTSTLSGDFSKPLKAAQYTLLGADQNRHPAAGAGEGRCDAHTSIGHYTPENCIKRALLRLKVKH